MWVCRQPNGQYRVQLTVARAEQIRRTIEREARKAASERAAEDILQQLTPPLRRLCSEFIERCGRRGAEQSFRDPLFLAAHKIDPKVATEILNGLEVFDQAVVERRLARHSLQQARSILDRFSKA